jgi:hypothetical protein
MARSSSAFSQRLWVACGVLAAVCCGALWAADAGTSPAGKAQAALATIIGTRLVALNSQLIRDEKGEGIPNATGYLLRINEGDTIEVTAVESIDKTQLEGNRTQVKVLTGVLAGKNVDMGLRAVVNSGATGFMYGLYDEYVPVPAHPPAWLDMSRMPPRVSKDVATAALQTVLESETEVWEVRFHAAIALLLRAETERGALESLARVVGDSRREIRMVAVQSLKRGRRILEFDGREIPNIYDRTPETLAQVTPILAEQLRRHPEQAPIVDLLRASGPSVVPAMVELIQAPFTQPSAASAASLLCVFPEQTRNHTALLWRAMATGNDWALQAALAADFGGTLAQLTVQLRSKDAAVRRRAADSLFLMGPVMREDLEKSQNVMEQTVSALREQIRAADSATLRSSVRALPWFGRLAVPALAELDRLIAQKPESVPTGEIQDAAARIRAMDK